jgi:acetyltransferase
MAPQVLRRIAMKPPLKKTDKRRHRGDQLDVFFHPKNVAVIGATETPGSVGRSILSNLIASPFGGPVFPVNPKRSSVLGIKAYKSIADVPEQVDLAVVVTPASSVPGVIHECADADINGAVVISAGFKEAGEEGQRLEAQLLKEAQAANIRIIGPNCLGVMCPISGLNATFASAVARPGSVGFLSQSGALCTAVLDWSFRENVGFSAFFSIGSMVDVGWGDLIDYLGADPHTKSIVIYMESVGNARAFLSAAREVALSKPVIVIKAGRSAAAAKAAASHTGALTGSDEVLEAAFRRCGVLRVERISDLFYMADVLGKQPRPRGPRLTILTNAGGPGVLATDSLMAEGGELAELSADTITQLSTFLPAHWSHANPVDILGDAGPDRYSKAIEVVSKDPASDGLLVVMTPQAMTHPTQLAEKLKEHAKLPSGKPILASWMGGVEVAAGDEILARAGIPSFPFPDTAARAFQYMWKYSENLRALYQTPAAPAGEDADVEQAQSILDTVRASGRTLLTEFESKALLDAYGIPTVKTLVASTEDQAVQHAAGIGYPVVLKLHSEVITHKTDVGGVALNLKDETAVRETYRRMSAIDHFLGVTVQPMVKLEGYELIVGASVDPQFGPVLLFGSGGQLVEVYKDRALALPPLNTTLARRMMERTRIFTALKGVRGRKPVDLGALEELMVRFSQLVSQQRWIKEIDINPLVASPDALIALDARVVLHDPATRESDLPRLSVRPYPARYISTWKMRDGSEVTFRPIRPEDEPAMASFHETLSEQTVYFRYFRLIKLDQRISHDRLTRICFTDYDRELVLVAERSLPNDQTEIIGVSRLTRVHQTTEAEFAVLISDRVQSQGLGTEMLRRTVDVASQEKISKITGEILPENRAMQRICEKVGLRLKYDADAGVVSAELEPGPVAIASV